MPDLEEIRADRDEALAPGLDPSDPVDAEEIEKARGEPWRVDGPSTASWALRKMAGAQRELDAIETAYQEEKARLDQWKERVSARPKRSLSYFEMQCNLYMRGLREGEGGDKDLHTKHLPGGTLKHTRSQTVEVLDVDAFIAWVEENDLPLVKTEKTPKKGDLKKVLAKDADKVLQPILVKDGKVTGERIPGIKVEVNDNYKAVPDLNAEPESSDEGRDE